MFVRWPKSCGSLERSISWPFEGEGEDSLYQGDYLSGLNIWAVVEKVDSFTIETRGPERGALIIFTFVCWRQVKGGTPSGTCFLLVGGGRFFAGRRRGMIYHLLNPTKGSSLERRFLHLLENQRTGCRHDFPYFWWEFFLVGTSP